jgi:hypothetical protein
MVGQNQPNSQANSGAMKFHRNETLNLLAIAFALVLGSWVINTLLQVFPTLSTLFVPEGIANVKILTSCITPFLVIGCLSRVVYLLIYDPEW